MNFTFKHFIGLNVLDVITTWYGLTYLGLTEQNTFANGLFESYGLVNALIAGKIIMLVFVYLCMFAYSPRIKKLAPNVVCIMFILVIFNNVYWMIR